MDLERSQVIDLLPVRSADSFAHWLGLQSRSGSDHPRSVQLVCRWRMAGRAFRRPITDRYHLVFNLSEAVERDIQQLQIDARKQLAQSEAREPEKTNKLR